MPNTCVKGSSGGKGNVGMFIERDKNICAAGVPSLQPELSVKSNLEWYVLQDEVDALIGDAIKPDQPRASLPPLRHPIPRDMRNAGTYSEGSLLICPPMKTKFQTIVENLKETGYDSYWNKPLGECRNLVPFLPEGYDIYGRTAGKKTLREETLYDVIMPKNPFPGDLPPCKSAAHQTDRNYCKPAYDPNRAYGVKSNIDKRGRWMKCCLTDDKLLLGTSAATPINTIQANLAQAKQAKLGEGTAPNDNISCVPEDFTFGKSTIVNPTETVAQCMSMCELNPDRIFFKKCLEHLNSLRKCMRKRFDVSFFSKLFLNLKYYDKGHTGWLPKQVVYDYCKTKYIYFNSTLIEPLLSAWKAFDGSQIEYKTLVFILNFTQSPPELPKVADISSECLDFRTTYGEMVKPGQDIDKKGRAGIPSGRYFDIDNPITPDGCCKAVRSYLCEESDAKSCLNPSIFTNLGISHRDMYAKREPHVVKRVFEASGERFTDDEFNLIWEAAKKYHHEGYVCYETFYRALEEKKCNEVKTEIVNS